MQMIEDASLGKFDLIITKEISRFSRNTLDSIKYTRELLSYGVAVLFLNDNINTALPDSELRLTIMSSLAQDEIRRLSERVKFGMNEAIKKGTVLGNNQLYGYRKNLLTKKIRIDKTEAQIVRRIFYLYTIQDKSLTSIANQLNKENIKTRSNKNWTAATLSRMIKNIKYQGYYCGKKTEITDYITKKVRFIPKEEWITYKAPEIIPQIIPQSLWEKANTKLKNTSKVKKQAQKKYSYSSKLFCKKSNAYFHRRLTNNTITWYCSSYLQKGKAACDSHSIKETELNLILKDIYKAIDLTRVETILKNIYKNPKLDSAIKELLTLDNILPSLNNLLLVKIIISKSSSLNLEIVLQERLPLKKSSYTFKRNTKTIKYNVKLKTP